LIIDNKCGLGEADTFLIVNKSPLTGIINGCGKIKENDNISLEFETDAAFYSTIERSAENYTENLIERSPEVPFEKGNEEKEMIIANLLDLREIECSKLNFRIENKFDPDSIANHLEKLAVFSKKMF
jgi:hypothetical protein